MWVFLGASCPSSLEGHTVLAKNGRSSALYFIRLVVCYDIHGVKGHSVLIQPNQLMRCVSDTVLTISKFLS